jgi:hypothetical protein
MERAAMICGPLFLKFRGTLQVQGLNKDDGSSVWMD